MQAPEALRASFESYLTSVTLHAELGALEGAIRYALDGGGKRIRPVICLATSEAAGGRVEDALAAAAALELVHTFSLVHDDLPAMDDDDERRGRPSAHVAFDEGIALLAGDALLAESQRLALSYARPEIARELAEATLGMIGGQYLDITGADIDLAELHRLKTGRLFAAAVGLGLWSAGVAEAEQAPWRAFGEELGLLFQVIDDILDGDGYAARLGDGAARAAAADAAARANACLDEVAAGETDVLRGTVAELVTRSS
jgi:geranylgeranyl diphosphate synthase type II